MPRNSTAPQKKSSRTVSGGDNGIVIGGDVVDSVVHNTVNQNFFQKVFINFFKPDTETLDQRNRRILLGHVENFWVKGVLEKSLHGAAMLELGIKEDPEAVTYPWAIKKEATDETLPAGISMLEIFEQIGMGRSLLILGAPGSGKTTMLLELARQLIERARQNADEPIPMVFNLASWTEKLSLADWLAQELNNIYSVPRKTAPDWVKGNKLLLLLDGLDEVRQESRAKCVDAINQFRKEHGLTSLAVCSRSQDYEELDTKLSFEGAIEVQPLTQKQVTVFFNRFGKEMAGLKQVVKKDTALREIAETPLFLSIMIMAYRDKPNVDILASQDMNAQRKHLFDNYIERMFEHPRSRNELYKKQDVLCWLSWLATKMIYNNQMPYLIERMQKHWLGEKNQVRWHRLIIGLIGSLSGGLYGGLGGGLFAWLENKSNYQWGNFGMIIGLVGGLFIGLIFGSLEIETVDRLNWSLKNAGVGLITGLIIGPIFGLVSGLVIALVVGLILGSDAWLAFGLNGSLFMGLLMWLTTTFLFGMGTQEVDQTILVGQRIRFSTINALLVFLICGLIFGLILGPTFSIFLNQTSGLQGMLIYGLVVGPVLGISIGMRYGGNAILQHYVLRINLAYHNLLPLRLIPFLDYCTDLIFLRRVGGGYIFVHRLLMEHFAAMYKE